MLGLGRGSLRCRVGALEQWTGCFLLKNKMLRVCNAGSTTKARSSRRFLNWALRDDFATEFTEGPRDDDYLI